MSIRTLKARAEQLLAMRYAENWRTAPNYKSELLNIASQLRDGSNGIKDGYKLANKLEALAVTLPLPSPSTAMIPKIVEYPDDSAPSVRRGRRKM